MTQTDDIFCPVCGYYCHGGGGVGCIDTPSLVENIEREERDITSRRKMATKNGIKQWTARTRKLMREATRP